MTGEPHPQHKWAAPFFAIWIGQAFSLFGSQLVQFVLVWWLTKTTGSATALATATLAVILPGILLGPFTGALVDRWNRRIVMIVADGLVALAAAVLVALFWAGAIRVWHIYLIMLARSVGGAFHWPAMQASTSLMVPEKHLSRVAGLNQMLNGVFNIVSPPLGAVLLGTLPFYGVITIDIITAALAILPLLFVQIPQPQRPPMDTTKASRASLWQDIRESLDFIASWSGGLALLGIATVNSFLLNPAFSLMPILVVRYFKGTAMQLGWIESAWGIGVVFGGLVLSVWGGFRRRILTILTGLVGVGLAVLFIGLAPATAFLLAVAAMFVAGFMYPIANGPVFAVLQSVVPPHMQGRVFMVVGSLVGAMSPLGMVIAGPVADWLGVRIWYLVGGAVCALMGAGAFFVPVIVHLEDDRGGRPSNVNSASFK